MSRKSRVILLGAVLLSGAGIGQGAPAESAFAGRGVVTLSPEVGCQGACSSVLQYAVTVPKAGQLSFRWGGLLDAGQKLLLELDGIVVRQLSGKHSRGAERLSLTPGNHVLRAEVRWGGAPPPVGAVWLEDARVTDGATIQVPAFNQAGASRLPAGWSSSGRGIWKTAEGQPVNGFRRAPAGAFRGYQAKSSVCASRRTFVWPATSTAKWVRLAYRLDTEEGHDSFQVLLDGVQRQVVSGRHRSGELTLQVTGGASHEVELAYAKDESGDQGLDDVQVVALAIGDESGVVEPGGFETATVGEGTAPWTVGTTATDGCEWVVAPATAPLTLAAPGTAFAAPAVDGLVGAPAGKSTSLRVPLYNSGQAAKRGDARLQLWNRGLVLGLRVPNAASTLGGSGEVQLYIDAQRAGTLAGVACGGTLYAGPEDRKLTITRLGTAAVVQQFKGDCAGGWSAVTPEEQWTVAAAPRRAASPRSAVLAPVSSAAPRLSGGSRVTDLSRFASARPRATAPSESRRGSSQAARRLRG